MEIVWEDSGSALLATARSIVIREEESKRGKKEEVPLERHEPSFAESVHFWVMNHQNRGAVRQLCAEFDACHHGTRTWCSKPSLRNGISVV